MFDPKRKIAKDTINNVNLDAKTKIVHACTEKLDTAKLGCRS
jgi:hypothetical protein